MKFHFKKVICISCTITLLAGMLTGCFGSSKTLNSKKSSKKSGLANLLVDPDTTTTTAASGLFPFLPTDETTEPTAESVPLETEPVTLPVEVPAETVPEITEPEPEPEPDEEEVVIALKPPVRTQWTGETTASVLRVREYPGTDYEIVRGIDRGGRVTILEQVTVDGEAWGRISDGWISMKYVALDGVIEGSWYKALEPTEDAYVYLVFNFHEDNTFSYAKYSLKPSENFSISRTLAQGGGQYRYDGERLQMELSYGDTIIVCSTTLSTSSSVIFSTDIYGISMGWDGYYERLTRGSLENIQKQLQTP